VTFTELAVTMLVLGGLGLAASRVGLSAIPAYLLAGILLGPNEPRVLSLVHPSEVTAFLAELGLVFLLFFLGLEFSLDRLRSSGRLLRIGGPVDLLVNGGVGAVVGLAAFGPTFPALVLAAAIYVSSSAVVVKGLTDLRRLADDETDLVLAILIFEDIAIALVLGFAGEGGGAFVSTLGAVGKALAFVTLGLAASRWLAPWLDRLLDALPLEFFLILTFALLVGFAGAAEEFGLSEAIGALMAGVVLAETDVREAIEERFFGFRDVFAAIFFFTFGLTIDVAGLGDAWVLVVTALVLSVAAKLVSGFAAGRATGYTDRQSLNAGAALVAHGEFTIILAELANENPAIEAAARGRLSEFAGLYVLSSATVGLILMKESKAVGRMLFTRRLEGTD
jgi:monovalent cation:H+ antiporter-2, CPA2 family